jgi:hypothetical protein
MGQPSPEDYKSDSSNIFNVISQFKENGCSKKELSIKYSKK